MSTSSTPGLNTTPNSLSPHEHLQHAYNHLVAAASAVQVDEAFRLAAYDGRITNYGNTVALRERIKWLAKAITDLQRPS